MEKFRKGCLLVCLAALIMIFSFSCSLGIQGVSSDTGISLFIGSDVISRLLTVVEYDVTTLDIAIKHGETVIYTFTWDPSRGRQRIFIPILNVGNFDIDVTHNGVKDGEEISITETAKFRMDFGIITIIRIIPGMVGVVDIDPGEEPGGPCDDFIAAWSGEVFVPDFSGGDPYLVDMDFNVLDSVGIGMVSRIPGTGTIDENFSYKGTWTCAGEYITGLWTDAWSTELNDWVIIPWGPPINWSATYSVDCDLLTINVDFAGNEPPIPMLTWEFIRAF